MNTEKSLEWLVIEQSGGSRASRLFRVLHGISDDSNEYVINACWVVSASPIGQVLVGVRVAICHITE